jgi:biotin carboxyl carrier protein
VKATFILREGETSEEITLERRGGDFFAERNGAVERLEAVWLPDGRLSVLFEDGRQVSGRVLFPEEGTVEVVTRHGRKRFGLADPLRDRLLRVRAQEADSGGREEIRSAMPGRVVEVLAAPGNAVAPGELLLILEAMKMQNEIRSERGGTVETLSVRPGDSVESGAILVVIAGHPKN